MANNKIDKKKLLDELKADMSSADQLQKEWKGIREEYKRETNGEPYGNEQKGKSRIVSKDIKKQLDWMIPTIADPFLSTPNIIKCNPITYEDVKAATQNELLLNTQFVRKFNRYNFINKGLKVLATEGTLVVQTGWDYQDEEVEIDTEVVSKDDLGNEHIVKVKTTETKVLVNKPTATICRNEDIFIDPTCMDDMDKCQFVIHRYETDLSTLRSDGRYKNLDKVAKVMANKDLDFDSEDDTEFEFKDKARKKVLVHEYWGNYDINGDGIVEPIVCVWVNDIIIRLEDNPYPDKKPPFIVVPFNSVPFQLFGEALAENIGDNQKVKTAIVRGLIDNMAKSNNGQVGIRKGALSPQDKQLFLKGKNFEFLTTPNDFWQGSYNPLPNSAFQMLSMMNNEIESQTGTKSFSGGITGNALGSTATAARGALDATSTRRLHLVRNVAENLIKPLMRKWMAYNNEFLEDEEVVRITNEQFVPVRRDDLEGRIDIDIEISTAEDNAAKSQELSFLLQTLGNTMPFEMTQLVMGKIAKLSRMPDLEEQIKEYKPKPDQYNEQMKQLALQKAALELDRMKAEILDKRARASENDVDRELKLRKAEVEAAKARKLHSDADMTDLTYIEKDHGFDKQYEYEMKERERLHQLQIMELQMLAGDKNIGVESV